MSKKELRLKVENSEKEKIVRLAREKKLSVSEYVRQCCLPSEKKQVVSYDKFFDIREQHLDEHAKKYGVERLTNGKIMKMFSDGDWEKLREIYLSVDN